MSIVIDTTDAGSYSYTQLVSDIARWMNRTDLGADIPLFVSLAEDRIAREIRNRMQVTSTVLSTVAGDRAVTLPEDWLEFESVGIEGGPYSSLTFAPTEHLNRQYPLGGCTALPIVYSIEGNSLVLGPVPDSTYNVTASYYARFPALATSATNWLLNNHRNVYLYGALREGSLFVMNDQRAGHWDGLYKQAVADLEGQNSQSTHSGSVLTVKTK